MFKFFIIPAADRRLIPDGRLTGPMPWVIAIMVFLSVLATALGLALQQSATQVDSELSRRVIVQIVDANPDERKRQADLAVTMLRDQKSIRHVALLSDQQVVDLIEPWLGGDGSASNLAADIPLPSLIDLTLAGDVNDARIRGLQNLLQPAVPAARVESSASYIEPVSDLITSLQWLALALVMLLALATGAAVIITARAALNTHRQTLDVIHLLGGTDQQISRLFQRRIALDALMGGLVGLLIGVVVTLLVGGQFSALGSGLTESFGLPWWSWLIIGSIPLLGMLIALVTARMTVTGALQKIL